jgi:predicted phosphoribosyltransferase
MIDEERSMQPYKDRRHAGEHLADALDAWAGRDDVVVLALPRGGVPVAAEVADRLGAPLDVLVVRKIGVPGHEELAMGAVADGGMVVRNEDVIRGAGIAPAAVEAAIHAETNEVRRRQQAYRGGRQPADLAGRVVVLVDDGLATGASMRVAVAAARYGHPRSIIVAVPVGAATTCDELATEADEVVCPLRPADFRAVGLWYEDFTQTTDDEVQNLLRG